MELEDLENRISDFLPHSLLPLNIKQELLENNETGNLCDSVEKRVSDFFFVLFFGLSIRIFKITTNYFLFPLFFFTKRLNRNLLTTLVNLQFRLNVYGVHKI